MTAAQQTNLAGVSGVTQKPHSFSALVVDDSALCREMICKTLRGDGFSTATANDGHDGIALLKQHAFDVVVLDNEMPRMDGISFLKALRAEKKWDPVKVVMLTTTSSKDVVIQALRYRICDYLMKERFSMPQMLERVRLAVKGKPAPAAPAKKPPKPTIESIKVSNLINRDAAMTALNDFSACKTLGGIVSQMAAISSSSHPSIGDAASAVRQDPVLAARLLQLAKGKATGIDEAVRTVSVKGVCELAASIGVLTEFPADREDGINLLRCWQHSMAVAAVMKRIVPRTDKIPSGLPQLIGLCHDVAEIFLRQKFHTEFKAACDYSHQAQAPLHELVNKVFGASYAEMTHSILASLAFPPSVAEPIQEFYRQSPAGTDAHASLLARSLAIANSLANGMLLTSSPESTVCPLAVQDCRAVLISTEPINTSEIRSESVMNACMLANVPQEAAGPLMKPLINFREVTVCYVRHATFAALDPVETALRSLGNVRVGVSKADDLAGAAAIVTMSPPADTSLLAETLRIRRSAKLDIPVLHLTSAANPDGEDEIIGVEHEICPISLSRLAEFVKSLKS